MTDLTELVVSLHPILRGLLGIGLGMVFVILISRR